MQINKGEWRQIIEPIMRGAGDILLRYFGNERLARTAKEQSGYLTEADLASERYLIEKLQGALPGSAVFAEESGQSGKDDYCWVIDPLDGTTNFAQGLPYFCISVALTYKDEPQVAAIYQPILNDFFYAERGGGAFLNDKPLAVSQPTDIHECVVAVGLPYLRKRRGPLVDALGRIVRKVYAVRHFGAVALDLANVACARLDGTFFAHLAWWDVAAGMLLIEEAGGVATDFDGKVITPKYTSCVAGGAFVHEALRAQLES